jgi:hypothetical protein
MCALVARDHDALAVLCSPLHIATLLDISATAAMELNAIPTLADVLPAHVDSHYYVFLSCGIAALVHKPEAAQAWLAQARLHLDKARREDPDVLGWLVDPVVEMASALSSPDGDFDAALARALKTHRDRYAPCDETPPDLDEQLDKEALRLVSIEVPAEKFGSVFRQVRQRLHERYQLTHPSPYDSQRLLSLEALGLATLAFDRGRLHDAGELPPALIRGEFLREHVRVSLDYHPLSVEKLDDAAQFLDLEGFPRSGQQSTMLQGGDGLRTAYTLGGRRDCPRARATFVLSRGSASRARALDAGERILLADLYSKQAETARSAGDARATIQLLERAMESIAAVLAMTEPVSQRQFPQRELESKYDADMGTVEIFQVVTVVDTLASDPGEQPKQVTLDSVRAWQLDSDLGPGDELLLLLRFPSSYFVEPDVETIDAALTTIRPSRTQCQRGSFPSTAPPIIVRWRTHGLSSDRPFNRYESQFDSEKGSVELFRVRTVVPALSGDPRVQRDQISMDTARERGLIARPGHELLIPLSTHYRDLLPGELDEAQIREDVIALLRQGTPEAVPAREIWNGRGHTLRSREPGRFRRDRLLAYQDGLAARLASLRS